MESNGISPSSGCSSRMPRAKSSAPRRLDQDQVREQEWNMGQDTTNNGEDDDQDEDVDERGDVSGLIDDAEAVEVSSDEEETWEPNERGKTKRPSKSNKSKKGDGTVSKSYVPSKAAKKAAVQRR